MDGKENPVMDVDLPQPNPLWELHKALVRDANITSRFDAPEVTAMAMVQAFGLVEPGAVVSSGFDNIGTAVAHVVDFVSRAHGEPAEVIHTNAEHLDMWIVRSPGGPTWGLVVTGF
jgi:hypothetical protein